MKIVAVVVTFNRLELLKECITSLRNQTRKLDEIIVVNNDSSDGTKEWLSDQKDLTKIHQANLGGAGGFYTGIKVAYENGYDWIWIMDDDAEAESNTLSKMTVKLSKDIAAICPDVYDSNNMRVSDHRSMRKNNFIMFYNLQKPLSSDVQNKNSVKIEVSSFVGPMINSKAIARVGLPIKDFFLHNDDVEYSLRLLEYGDIILLPKNKIFHREQNTKTVIEHKIFGKQIFRQIYSQYWIKYFTLRNFYFVLILHSQSKLQIYMSIFFTCIREMILIIFFDDHKTKRIMLVLKSVKDALENNLTDKIGTIKSLLYS